MGLCIHQGRMTVKGFCQALELLEEAWRHLMRREDALFPIIKHLIDAYYSLISNCWFFLGATVNSLEAQRNQIILGSSKDLSEQHETAVGKSLVSV